jgi:hypothetical protein
MIHLKFHTQGRAFWAFTAADQGLRFADGRLWREGEPQRLARFRGEHWELGTELFADIAISESVTAQFHSASGRCSAEYGAFACFETRGGTAYIGEQVFARYSEAENAWIHEKSGSRWEAMLVRRAVSSL